MYERSAIVLERFFSNLLGLNKVNNLKRNFNNYCELFEKFKVSQTASAEEFSALKDFQDAENEIEEIQSHEEKLYKKNAKLEYNRDLVFQDISQKPDEIEKCSLKLEADITKVQEKYVSLREEFVEAIRDYNAKKSALSKCKKTRKNAENEYNAIFDEAKNNLENIPEECIEASKEFPESNIQEDIINTMIENGKDEKIPFNNQVITNAAKIGFDIASREITLYMQAYNLAQKLINELLEGAVSMELHEKAIRNISAELNFLSAEKEYMVGFLDYERITVIYGKRMHRSLMIDACEKLEKDIEQVENLYKLLSKEINEKPTKKAYRELYNKSYLMEMEDKDAKFRKEKNRVNLSTGTIMNSNYWRIEGIKNIYTVFYKNIVEIFGKDLDEFEIPEEQEELFDEEGNPIETQEITEEVIEEADVSKIQKTEKEETIEETTELEAKIDSALEELDDFEEEPTPKAKTKTKKKKVYTSKERLGAKVNKKQEKVAAFEEIPVQDDVKIQEIVPEEVIEPERIEVIEETADVVTDLKKTLKLAKIVKKRGRKKVKHYTRQIIQQEETVLVEEIHQSQEPVLIEETASTQELAEEFDIFGDKYRDIDLKIAELDDLEEYEVESPKNEDESVGETEESIFDIMEDSKDNIDFAEIEMDKKADKKKSKNKLFSSLKKLNSKSKKDLVKE